MHLQYATKSEGILNISSCYIDGCCFKFAAFKETLSVLVFALSWRGENATDVNS